MLNKKGSRSGLHTGNTNILLFLFSGKPFASHFISTIILQQRYDGDEDDNEDEQGEGNDGYKKLYINKWLLNNKHWIKFGQRLRLMESYGL